MKTLSIFAVCAIAVPAAAQVKATGKTTTEMSAKATCGTNSKTDTEKTNTAFTRSIGVGASYRFCSSAGGSGRVGSHYDWWRRKTVTYAKASAGSSVWGYQTSSKGSANVGGAKGNGLQFTFAADKDTKGKLTITVGGFASTKQSSFASVKFGSTTIAWKSGERAKTQTMDVTIGKSGMTFDTITQSDAALAGRGRASASSYVSISFAADATSSGKCEIKKGVDGCGPELAGTASSSFFGHTITFKLTKAYPNALGLRLWSPDGKTVVVGKCPLFTNVGIVAGFTTDKNGEATSVARLGRGDFKSSVEAIVLRIGSSGLEWQSSNTLDVTCSK